MRLSDEELGRLLAAVDEELRTVRRAMRNLIAIVFRQFSKAKLLPRPRELARILGCNPRVLLHGRRHRYSPAATLNPSLDKLYVACARDWTNGRRDAAIMAIVHDVGLTVSAAASLRSAEARLGAGAFYRQQTRYRITATRLDVLQRWAKTRGREGLS